MSIVAHNKLHCNLTEKKKKYYKIYCGTLSSETNYKNESKRRILLIISMASFTFLIRQSPHHLEEKNVSKDQPKVQSDYFL